MCTFRFEMTSWKLEITFFFFILTWSPLILPTFLIWFSISAAKENGDLANRQKIVCPKMRKKQIFPKRTTAADAILIRNLYSEITPNVLILIFRALLLLLFPSTALGKYFCRTNTKSVLGIYTCQGHSFINLSETRFNSFLWIVASPQKDPSQHIRLVIRDSFV